MGLAYFLPVAPGRLSDDVHQTFWSQTPAAGSPFTVRWIGMDEDSTNQIFELIRAKDKTGTFTLPEVLSQEGFPTPQKSDGIILTAFDGTPTLGLQLSEIWETTWGAITEKDTAVDGTPVRALDVWRPLHTAYWTPMLEPYGQQLEDDTRVLIERFELIYDAG